MNIKKLLPLALLSLISLYASGRSVYNVFARDGKLAALAILGDPNPTPVVAQVDVVTTTTASPTSIPKNVCIITLSGKQYNVTSLAAGGHPGPTGSTLNGGNGFFKCGTDMTAVYNSQHGASLSRMAPYLVKNNTPSASPTTSSPTTSPTSVASTTPTISPKNDDRNDDGEDHDDDDRDDKRNEDRYLESGRRGKSEDHGN